MHNRPAEIIVRCEDLQQRCFLYRFLVEKGIHPRAIQIKHCPGGDAKRFVFDEHPVQVKALRTVPHLSKAVISMIDADDCTVADRKKQCDEALAASGLQPRAASERIAVLTPRRNIETWVHHLLGEAVNEHDEYPKFRGEERKCAPAAKVFAGRCPNRMLDEDIPSLRDGCMELKRIL